MLLSPTHEEEITTLVAGLTKSYRELPLRLYQISRKYRDEPRPRQGLLRGREFLMKDLYTFDYDAEAAIETYNAARSAYDGFFDEFKLPYLVAKADPGNMGGNLSHEYQFPSTKGEDTIVNCSNCELVKNEELVEVGTHHPPAAITRTEPADDSPDDPGYVQWTGITQDRSRLVKAICLKGRRINPYAVRELVPTLDLGLERPEELFYTALRQSAHPPGQQPGNSELSVLYVIDRSVRNHRSLEVWCQGRLDLVPDDVSVCITGTGPSEVLNLTLTENGDQCPNCGGKTLAAQRTVEVGHTFYLGTRYSDSLEAKVAIKPGSADADVSLPQTKSVSLQMGCYGIGISRMIAVLADVLADDKGLNWPRVVAPFEVVVIPTHETEEDAALAYDHLVSNMMPEITDHTLKQQRTRVDAVLDDRAKHLPWKLKDADLIGYPVAVILGRSWTRNRKCEVQCRRLNVQEEVPIGELLPYVSSVLARL